MSAKILPFPSTSQARLPGVLVRRHRSDSFAEAVTEIHQEVATLLNDLLLYADGRLDIQPSLLATRLNGAASLLRIAGDSVRRRPDTPKKATPTTATTPKAAATDSAQPE
jgi:hypothetical protein